jgi:ATP phosphoribosyltransferase-like protein
VATEYVQLAQRWIETSGIDASVLRSYGATEVLPPEDADAIIDNTASGATLAANGLRIVGELMRSSTRLYASRAALEDQQKRERIERFVVLVRSVLEARDRVMLELNVPAASLEAVVAALPCMREPTVSRLSSGGGFAVKTAVRRSELPEVIPVVRGLGGTDLIVTRPEQIVI